MDKLQLIEPTVLYKNQFLDFIEDWAKTDEKRVPFVLDMDFSDFDKYLKNLKDCCLGIGIPTAFVPHTTYWLIGEGRLIGVSNLRHSLTEKLMIEGGNIGYGIRPSERKKGYATFLLNQTLNKAKEIGLSKVLITCEKSNLGSVRTIVKNGGVLDSEGEVEGVMFQRYWVDLC